MGYTLRPNVPQEAIIAARALVEEATTRSSTSVVLAEITRCFAVTKSREQDEMDIQATLAGMVDGLREFPPDVVRDACRAYARCEKFRPSLADLREYCWHRYQARNGLLSALKSR